MSIAGQVSLNNFYQSVQFSYPVLASQMIENIEIVALYAVGRDQSGGRAAADSLRRQSDDLPEIFRRVLGNALIEMGYS